MEGQLPVITDHTHMHIQTCNICAVIVCEYGDRHMCPVKQSGGQAARHVRKRALLLLNLSINIIIFLE